MAECVNELSEVLTIMISLEMMRNKMFFKNQNPLFGFSFFVLLCI